MSDMELDMAIREMTRCHRLPWFPMWVWAGTFLISFYMITYAHAERHGYDSPDKMAREADFLMWNRHDTANYFIKRKKRTANRVNG